MINNNIDCTPTNKVYVVLVIYKYDVYFAICKTLFCSFIDHLCKSCFKLCDHNCFNTDVSNVLITKHETKELNMCLVEKTFKLNVKSVIYVYSDSCFVIYKYKLYNSSCPICNTNYKRLCYL